MNSQNQAPLFATFLATAAFCVLAGAGASAEPMKIEAVVTPKADAKMEFADGSKRYVLAAQREGKTTGTGPLAGTTMLEWGFHDVNPATGANSNGYLVFTAVGGDIAYVKYQSRAVPVPGPDGKPRFLANGVWETVGGTGKLQGLRGTGTLHFYPRERQWVLEGEMVATD